MTQNEVKEYLRGGGIIIIPDRGNFFLNSYKQVVCCDTSSSDFASVFEFLEYIDVSEAEPDDD